MNFFRSLVVPDVQGHLLVDEGEVIIDEVRKHWAATFWWYALASLGIPLLLAALGAEALWWGPVLLGVAVFDRSLATMPMTRILDISMYRSLMGQVLGYGHFVFESAAQGQGLREIRYVGDPDRRDLTIQRVIQRSGLRQTMRMDPVSVETPNEADGV